MTDDSRCTWTPRLAGELALPDSAAVMLTPLPLRWGRGAGGPEPMTARALAPKPHPGQGSPRKHGTSLLHPVMPDSKEERAGHTGAARGHPQPEPAQPEPRVRTRTQRSQNGGSTVCPVLL